MNTAAFKSPRSAKILFTKAFRAYEAARDARIQRDYAARETGYDDVAFQEIEALKATEEKCENAALAIYNAAKAQDIYIHSTHFVPTGTMELIRQNID